MWEELKNICSRVTINSNKVKKLDRKIIWKCLINYNIEWLQSNKKTISGKWNGCDKLWIFENFINKLMATSERL